MPKSITETDAETGVDAFLSQVASREVTARPAGVGRLVFAMDATASRQPSWDQAAAVQGQMFTRCEPLSGLSVQLVYYRGFDECRASPWVQGSDALLRLMGKVRCEAGRTQIQRVLKHALAETRRQPVQAVVFVGDCCEEPVDSLGELAGQMKLLAVPLFIFQEGHDSTAHRVFAQLAKVSGGAHCRFDAGAASRLAELLSAVAVYAAGGKAAVQQQLAHTEGAKALLEQL